MKLDLMSKELLGKHEKSGNELLFFIFQGYISKYVLICLISRVHDLGQGKAFYPLALFLHFIIELLLSYSLMSIRMDSGKLVFKYDLFLIRYLWPSS